MKIRFKKLHEDAITPTKAHPNDAGFDLYIHQDLTIGVGTMSKISTGIAIEIPPGYVGYVSGRCGNTFNRRLFCQLGVIDCGYHGDIGVILVNDSANHIHIKSGERIGQIVILPTPQIELVEDPNFETDDRKGGFGSTGD